MKQILATLVFLTLVASTVFAQQQYRVSAVSFGSGENPITSGIFGTVQLTTESGGFIEVTAQQEQAWFQMGREFKTSKTQCSLRGSIGHLQGAPWIGPYAGCSVTLAKVAGQEVSLGAVTRPGWFLGREPSGRRDDGKDNPENLFVAYLTIAALNIGGVGLSLSHLDYLDDPTDWLSGVSYTHKVRKDLEVTGSATWDQNSERVMYLIGATWRLAK